MLVYVKYDHGYRALNLMLHSDVDSGQPSISVPGPISRVKNDPPNSGEFSAAYI